MTKHWLCARNYPKYLKEIKSFNPHNYPLTCVILFLLPFYSHRNWGLTLRAQSHTTATQLTQDLKAIQLPALIITLLTTCLQWYTIIIHCPTLPFQAPWNIFILWLYLRNHAMAPYHHRAFHTCQPRGNGCFYNLLSAFSDLEELPLSSLQKFKRRKSF